MKNDKKIGIITLYYNNFNYGGLLQAYALQHYLSINGFQAEQITFDSQITDTTFLKQNIINRTGIRRFRAVLRYLKYLFTKKINIYFHKNAYECINRRISHFKKIQKDIPHSDFVYTQDNIVDALNKYDIFVCGSDVIWNAGINPYVSCLGFVEGKYKFAYAPSLGVATLPLGWFEQYELYLRSLNGISVRENSIKSELQELLQRKDINNVVDPTLLLTKEQWKANLDLNDSNRTEYILCYLLGSSKKQRELIEKASSVADLPILTFPYIGNIYRHIDDDFGHIKDFESDPLHFLKEIVRAEIVITDSFHAVVFSLIFHKTFWAVKRYFRELDSGMNGRVQNLLKLVGLESRIIENNQITTVDLYQKVDFQHSDDVISMMRKHSQKYINDNLNQAMKKEGKM